MSQCCLLHQLQSRYLLWGGPPQPSRDPLLWCLPSFFSGLDSTLYFLAFSSARVLILPFLKYVTPEAPLSQLQGCVWPFSPTLPEHCHEHLFILSFLLLLFPFPRCFIFLLSHLLSLLPISSLFLILLPVSSLFLSCPPHLHPTTSCPDKRIILLLKQKYKIILNLFL